MGPRASLASVESKIIIPNPGMDSFTEHLTRVINTSSYLVDPGFKLWLGDRLY
jgi:hypothetical protein